MANERHNDEQYDQAQAPKEELENVEVNELDDENLGDSSGGQFQQNEGFLDWNCGC
jgi:ABC-type Mn2+/Zn2+ transport system ATPase subunit